MRLPGAAAERIGQDERRLPPAGERNDFELAVQKVSVYYNAFGEYPGDDPGKACRVVVIIGLAMMADLVVYWVLRGLFDPGTMKLAPARLPGSIVQTIKFMLLGVTAVLFAVIRSIDDLVLQTGGAQAGMPGTIAGEGQQDTRTVARHEAFMHQARAHQAAKTK